MGLSINFVTPLKSTEWLAEKLKLKRDTIQKNRAYFPERVPPHYQVLGCVRYSEAEVEAWLREQ